MDLEKLKEPEAAGLYLQKLEENLNTPRHAANMLTIEEDWHSLKGALLQAAESALGHRRADPRNEWFDASCWQAIEKYSQKRIYRMTDQKQENNIWNQEEKPNRPSRRRKEYTPIRS